MPTNFNQQIIEEFRANQGKVTNPNFLNSDLLLLTTTGAKSGNPHTVPVVYSKDGDRIVIIASYGGAPTNPAWFHNLVVHPEVTIEVGDEKFLAKATVVEDDTERDRLYAQHANRYPGFNDYKAKTDRKIPVIVLEHQG